MKLYRSYDLLGILLESGEHMQRYAKTFEKRIIRTCY